MLNDKNPVAAKINSQILNCFMINSFRQSELKEFRWYDVLFSSEIKEKILFISFGGEYYGPYPNDIEDVLYFDLKTGASLKPTSIPFQALFTLSGYFAFLNKYWLKGVKKEFKTAVECAGMVPYCSYYDISNYNVKNNIVSIELTHDCYPHVVQGCTPFYEIEVTLDSIKQYLNSQGKYILIESNYLSKSPIEKFLENKKLKREIENNLFIFGKMNDKHLISMAINIDNQGIVSGFYYDDLTLQKRLLKGLKKDSIIVLTESFNKKKTGFIELKFLNQYDSKGFFFYNPSGENKYLVGKWMDVARTRKMNINITEIKTNELFR